MDLCNSSELSAVLSRFGFSFSKALGQNFLVARWVVEQMVDESGLDGSFGVLEIGPGAGCLTRELSAAAGKVLAVELDRRLLPVLDYTLSDCPNVRVVNGDAMELDLAALCREEFGGMRLGVCANLPYSVTTPIITKLLAYDVFDTLTLMVQKEVARRLCAAPGSPECGSITAFTRFYTEPDYLFTVPSGCYRPAPKVDSAVIRLTRKKERAVRKEEEHLFFRTVRAAFGQRRKTLLNCLASGFSELTKEEAGEVLDRVSLPRDIRGEKLSVEDFARLSRAIAARIVK